MATKTHTRKPIVQISSVETIREQLLQLKPKPTHAKEQRIADLYPLIQELMANKVTQRDILVILANNGVTLSPARFKALLQKCSDATANDETDIEIPPTEASRPVKPPLPGFRTVDARTSALAYQKAPDNHTGENKEDRA